MFEALDLTGDEKVAKLARHNSRTSARESASGLGAVAGAGFGAVGGLGKCLTRQAKGVGMKVFVVAKGEILAFGAGDVTSTKALDVFTSDEEDEGVDDAQAMYGVNDVSNGGGSSGSSSGRAGGADAGRGRVVAIQDESVLPGSVSSLASVEEEEGGQGGRGRLNTVQRKVVEIDSGLRSDDERMAQQQNLARTQSHKDTLERVAAKKNTTRGPEMTVGP